MDKFSDPGKRVFAKAQPALTRQVFQERERSNGNRLSSLALCGEWGLDVFRSTEKAPLQSLFAFAPRQNLPGFHLPDSLSWLKIDVSDMYRLDARLPPVPNGRELRCSTPAAVHASLPAGNEWRAQ